MESAVTNFIRLFFVFSMIYLPDDESQLLVQQEFLPKSTNAVDAREHRLYFGLKENFSIQNFRFALTNRILATHASIHHSVANNVP